MYNHSLICPCCTVSLETWKIHLLLLQITSTTALIRYCTAPGVKLLCLDSKQRLKSPNLIFFKYELHRFPWRILFNSKIRCHQRLNSINLRKKLSVKDLKYLLMQGKKDIELCISWHSLLENWVIFIYPKASRNLSAYTPETQVSNFTHSLDTSLENKWHAFPSFSEKLRTTGLQTANLL